MIDVLETEFRHRERDRLIALGHRTDDKHCTLLPLPFDRIALPGNPSDPAQICPQCYRAKATR